MTQFVAVLETTIYLLCFLSIIRNIYGCEINRKWCVAISAGTALALFVAVFTLGEAEFYILFFAVQLIQMVLVYFSASNIRLASVIAMYGFLYGINAVIIAGISSLWPLSQETIAVIELSVSLVTATCCMLCCYHRFWRHRVQQMLAVIPASIKCLAVLLFVTCAYLMELIVALSAMYEVSAWSIAMRISLVAFSITICITFPVLLITVLTNAVLKRQNESFERELETQARHYVMLSESNKELRRFRHDLKNLRIGMVNALASGDTKTALQMIENGEYSFNQATDPLRRFDTGNGIVDAILGEKQIKAARTNSHIIFDGRIPQTAFSPTDLCVIFGNALDNAIEACERIPIDTEKVVSVSVNCNSGFAFIAISNPVAEKVVVHNNSIQTTKKDRSAHGFGLYSLQKIAKKYDGEVNISCEDHQFTISMDLCLAVK